jgi:hypothetical protein
MTPAQAHGRAYGPLARPARASKGWFGLLGLKRLHVHRDVSVLARRYCLVQIPIGDNRLALQLACISHGGPGANEQELYLPHMLDCTQIRAVLRLGTFDRYKP